MPSNNYAPDPSPDYNRVTPWTTAQLRTACEETPACAGGYNMRADCAGDLDGDQFCVAGYLAALEAGIEFWPEANIPSLCLMHWQHLLDLAHEHDEMHTLQLANATAHDFYAAARAQMSRIANPHAWQRRLDCASESEQTRQEPPHSYEHLPQSRQGRKQTTTRAGRTCRQRQDVYRAHARHVPR